ncbi:MAG: hypothetical protein GX135_03120 [Candidatus Cloacimonetes bacterium]|nr:hypothetical protein [Candidatus Cloacimonadota bacterium]
MKRVFLALILCWITVLSAQSLSQTLVGADDLSVGDRFKLELRASEDLRSVAVPDTMQNFRVLKWELKKETNQPDWINMTIVPLLPGSQSFPSLEVFPVNLTTPTMQTDRFRLNIVAVRDPADTLLVDLKPLEKYPLQLPWWLYWGLAGLALLGIALAFLIKPKTAPIEKPEQQDVPETAIPEPAWKIALTKLDALIAEELMLRGEQKQHHFRLSEILRQFLQRKYRFAAMEMSTSEIQWKTSRIHVASSYEVIGFLKYCDQVKFAKYQPEWEQADAAQNWLRNWLMAFEVDEAREKLSTAGGGDV